MRMAKLLKWVTFVWALFLAIPFVGGLDLFGSPWIPSLVALVLNLVAWLVLKKQELPTMGNLFGILASVVGVLDIMGWILHGTTAFLLLIEGVVMHMREEGDVAQTAGN